MSDELLLTDEEIDEALSRTMPIREALDVLLKAQLAKLKAMGYVKWDREKVARRLASLDNRPYDGLDERIVRINQGLTKECYLRRADQLKEKLTE